MQPVGQVGSARHLRICSREIRAGREGTCPGFVWALERGQTRNWRLSGVPVTSRVGILGATSQTRVRARSTSVSQCPAPCSRPVGEYPGLVGSPQGPGAGAEAAMGLISMGAESRGMYGVIPGLWTPEKGYPSSEVWPCFSSWIFNLGVELAARARRCSFSPCLGPAVSPHGCLCSSLFSRGGIGVVLNPRNVKGPLLLPVLPSSLQGQ